MERLRCIRLVVLAVLILVAVAPAWSAAMEDYAITHFFALPTATTTRLFGMGGFSSCIPDDGFGNPAFAGDLFDTSFLARKAVISFSGGLRLNQQQASVAFPLHDGFDGLQITGLHLGSNRAILPDTYPSIPRSIAMSERDVSIHYGRRVGRNLLVGVATSPIFRSKLEVDALGTPPMPLAHLKSKAEWGFRVGGVYELGDRGWLGATYDRYTEEVTGAGLMFPSGPETADFRSTEIVCGVAYKLTDRLLGAVEWQELKQRGPGGTNAEAGIRFGIEGRLDKNMFVRMGSNQGSWSAGLGWADDRWAVNYAYIKDWNDNILGPVFGSSNTHSFEASCSW